MTRTQKLLWILDVPTRLHFFSECWTRGGVLICCTNCRSRTNTNLGAGKETERKTAEPRNWVSMNLGCWAHGVTGVVNAIIWRGKTLSLRPDTGATYWPDSSGVNTRSASNHQDSWQPCSLPGERTQYPEKPTLIVEPCQWTSPVQMALWFLLSLKFGLIWRGHFEFFKE